MPLSEGQKKYKSGWRKRNREKENAYAKAYRSDPNRPDRYEKHLVRMREYYHKNKDRIGAEQKQKRLDNPLLNRGRHLQTKYGITQDVYKELLALQNNGCAICNRLGGEKGQAHVLHVDHDHASGKIRGLLCSRCNTALGLVKENLATLRSMIAYVEKYA